MHQDLSKFSMPKNFRGRNVLWVQLWRIVHGTFFRFSPWSANSFRCQLLRAFGASVGKSVVIRPSAVVTYPWKVSIGDFSWIGENATLYSLGEIKIGHNTVISQNSYLCAGDHDFRDPTFAIRAGPVIVGSGAWVAADVFIAPGSEVGDGAVISARSSVFGGVPPETVCRGNPASPISKRSFATSDG